MACRTALWWLVLGGLPAVVTAQGIPLPPSSATSERTAEVRKFADPEAGFELELLPGWRSENAIENDGRRVLEIIYRDRSQALLKVKRETIPADCADEPARCLADREAETSLQFRPDFQLKKRERFSTAIARGTLLTFTFRRVGKPMTGRYYFLQTDDQTIWVLRFEGETRFHDTLRYQTDRLAYSFRPLP
ncbi:MAG: hypothetical protein SNJ67_06015 [Chloracidobacterium sp.]|uniref:Uncharacterized protein n=1 Tax=Chloracidobacterium validum TaxID=2821543 RepID=A0ABX8B6I5_9BACT|nr:hypothetical protein [Chloracidobacterium validum]QUW02577.1 hypothetical protein J8C06_09525 [Chloracidobacterium validum]